MSLRPYQSRAIQDLYNWLSKHQGHPCLVLPTGSGKSHIVAELCRDALQNWPETRILMLTHQKELIEQNAAKLRDHWPGAPLGICSASIGRKDLDEPITFAGIQSVRNKAQQIGHIDLCIIDECFVAGTKVETPSGQVDIDKVRCGDIVLNQCGFGVVEAISCKPTFDTYLVELEDGRSIECTGNHPFFTQDGWCQARGLENGSYILGVQDMSSLWGNIQTLGEVQRGRKDYFRDAGSFMEQAKLLLSSVCQEIQSDRPKCPSPQKNQQSAEGNSPQTYKAWRERAIAAFTAIGAAPCIGGWVDSGTSNQDPRRSSQWRVSERLQGGHRQYRGDDSNRIGWRIARQSRKAGAGSKEGRIFNGSRVARVSHIKRESPVPVFNLQVSGHPSFFVNGLGVHNCHLIGHKDEGSYRTLLRDLMAINEHMRVIGLTATPWRLGHGLITDKPAIFNDLIEPVLIEQLIALGFLSPLRSKLTDVKYDLTGVHKRGGEWIESELAKAVNTVNYNTHVATDILRYGADRKSWLLFCSGIEHSRAMAQEMNMRGIRSECVTGETPKAERERILRQFKDGEIRCLTNANVLTTGFDAPNIDLIAMLRPTMSPSLYVQMAGRGMRIAPGKEDCLVLDFAGVVQMHGPITAIQPPKKSGSGNGDAPVKSCEKCWELVHISAKACPACGEPFPEPEKEEDDLRLRDDDIMGKALSEMEITSWDWREHVSKASGKAMLAVTYYGRLSDKPIREYFPVTHIGYAGEKALNLVGFIANKAGVSFTPGTDLVDWANTLNAGDPPRLIKYKMDGKYHRVISRSWTNATA